jgi:hypothetical protein
MKRRVFIYLSTIFIFALVFSFTFALSDMAQAGQGQGPPGLDQCCIIPATQYCSEGKGYFDKDVWECLTVSNPYDCPVVLVHCQYE